jgi:hypothetical protein
MLESPGLSSAAEGHALRRAASSTGPGSVSPTGGGDASPSSLIRDFRRPEVAELSGGAMPSGDARAATTTGARL